MDAVTILIAGLGAFAVWLMTPARGLVVYVAVLCLYPQYLAVSIATVDWTSSRIVALSLLVRIVTYRAQPPAYQLLWMDVLVLLDFFGDATAHFITGPIDKAVVREAGQFFDYVLPYFLVRYSIRSREDIFTFFKWVTIIAVPLALVGLFQTLTGTNPYAFMREYSPWDIGEQEIDVRYGLYRADGPFGNKISFGLFFALALTLHIGGLFAGRIRPVSWLTRAGAILAGLVSAMSSAPLFAAFCSMGWIAVRPLRRYLPYVFAVFCAFLLFVELYSDRHFYHVLTRFALSSSTAFYRIELIEEALGGGMDGHWIAGYGYVGVGPGTDNTNFHWEHKDFVNIYIGRLATGGLMSVLPLMLLNAYYYFALYKAAKLARTFETSWMIWCLTAGMIGWNVAMMTVGALEQTYNLMGMMIGVIAVWLRLLARGEDALPEPEPEPEPVPPRPVPTSPRTGANRDSARSKPFFE